MIISHTFTIHDHKELIQNKEYDLAAIILMEGMDKTIDWRRSKLFEILKRISNKKIFNDAIKFLAEEELHNAKASILSKKMSVIFHNDLEYFIQLKKSFIESKSLSEFNKIVLGEISKEESSILINILTKGKIDTLKTIASHDNKNNERLNKIIDKKLYEKIEDTITKKGFDQILNPFITLKNKSKKKKLKIAICISGQLRGYREAFKSWQKFGFNSHDIDIYASVWRNTGRRKIQKSHLNRIFHERFEKVFRDYTSGKSDQEIAYLLPSLYKYFDVDVPITERDIIDTYSPEKFEIIEDSNFSDKDNKFKMHFMIERSFSLIDDPEKYDLLIRVRPDKSLDNFNIDWEDIYSTLDDKTILVSNPCKIHSVVGFVMDDQFAVGKPNPMREYFTTFRKCQEKEGVFKSEEYHQFRAHMSLFLSLVEQSINVQTITDFERDIAWGELLDAEKISDHHLKKLLKEDVKDKKELAKLIEPLI